MADLCLRQMPNVEFHLITCDKLGVVLIAPSEAAGHHMIYRIESHPTALGLLPGQLGAGDILMATLALEYAALNKRGDFKSQAGRTQGMLAALEKAQAVTSCYLGMDWHQIPTGHEIEKFTLQPSVVTKKIQVDDAVQLLPPKDVNLDDNEIRTSGLVSTDETYIGTVEELIGFVTDGWEDPHPRSIILTGKGGVGKSDLQSLLSRELQKSGISLWSFDNSPQTKSLELALAAIAHQQTEISRGAGLLILIDEAFSTAGHLLLGENGKNLIQGLPSKTRLLLIDADFNRYRNEVSQSQLITRCKCFELPPLSLRLPDIPYIFGASCVKHLGVSPVKITEAVLLSVIRDVLNDPERKTGRDLYNAAGEIIKHARADPSFSN